MITDMTYGSPLKRIFSYFFPLLFSTVFQQLYSITDSVIVGKFISKNALAAVNSTTTLNWMIFSFIIGFVTGEGVLVSRAFGAKDFKKMRNCIANGIYVAVFVGVIITFFALVFIKRILVVMDVPQEIFSDTYTYIFIIMAGYPVTIASSYIGMLIQSVGDGSNAMIRGIISTVVNIVMDLVFVIVFNMGVEGVAIATVLSNAINFVIALIFYIKKYEILHIGKSDFKFNKFIVKKTILIGLPNGLQSSVTMLGCTLVQGSVNALGTNYIAAYSTALKIENMVTMPLMALANSMPPFVAQNYGAHKVDRIKKSLKQVLLIAVIYGAVIGVLLRFLGEKIALMYLNSNETQTLELINYYFLFSGTLLFMLCVLYVIRSTITSLGFSAFTALGGLVELGCRLFVVFALVGNIGYTAICISNPMSWFFTSAMLFIAYFTYIKRKFKEIEKTSG